MLSIVIIIITTLLFSAFCSGMEIAFISANRLKLEIQKKENPTFGRIADVFLRKPGQYITTILVGNNIALVIYSLNMTILLNMIASRYGFSMGQGSIIIETLISTIIIIFSAEFVPKNVVKNNPNFFLKLFAAPLFVIYVILYPIARFSTWLSVKILRLFGLKVSTDNDMNSFSRVDLAHMIEEASDNEQEKAEHEIKIFQNALDFSDVRVRDCMVPRVDIEAVDILDTIVDITERFVDTNYSRIFVYDGSIDNIIGYVNTKSLFTSPENISEVLMEVDFVPESLSAQKLLSLLIKKNRALAVVIDEYGGTAGIVSMEDVLEEIFGEIEDEHDSPDLVEKVTAEGHYVLSGRLEVDYLNEKYGFKIPESEEYDTIAGYIIYNHEGIPSQGEVIVLGNIEFRILRVDSSKLDLVKAAIL